MSVAITEQFRCGVLLHPTSLPSGKLDDDVFRWLDLMADAGLRVWQILPLGMPLAGLSPYQCISSMATNPALLPADTEDVSNDDPEYLDWCEHESHWIEDFALFLVIKSQLGNKQWFEWPHDYRNRDENTLKAFSQQHTKAMASIYKQQFKLYRCWNKIREAASERDILIFGDMPIFVAHDSADVWANQQRFLLDESGYPTVVTGVPPDYFSETGQRWGNPHYDWEQLEKEDFLFWKQRLQHHFEWFDLVRLDHFRGLEAVWVIAADCETAVDGYWQKTPGDALLTQLQKDMQYIPMVAEDLGVITPEVIALRKKFHLPGMSVLQFAFDAFEDNPHKPQNITSDKVAFTGTHDNNTTQGWFNDLQDHEKQFVRDMLGITDEANIVDALLERALASRACLAIIPMQDFLYLGSEARMNTPGTIEGNWQWRFDWKKIPDDFAVRIREKIKLSQRDI
jgi:4-alpha-glucanotransferase